MSTQLKIFEHIILRQDYAENEILKAYENGEYSFEKPFVCVNPYLIAPLTALVMFETEDKTSVKVVVKGKTTDADLTLEYSEANKHVLEIIGLYPGQKNEVELRKDNGQTVVLEICTDNLPEQVLLPTEIKTEDFKIWANSLVFAVPADNKYRAAAYDVNGDCRWYTNEKFAYTLKRGQNGRILAGAPKLLAIPYSPTTLYEMSLIGKVYKEYRVPRGYHHDYLELDNDKILFLTQNIEMGTSGDVIALFDKKTGKVVCEWDMKDLLPQDVAGSGSQDMHDWFHMNSIAYNNETKNFTVSGRHQDIIVNFNSETNQINWMLGDPEGWPEEYVNNYFLQPEGELEWAYEPHAVKWLNDELLLCFDSGHYRAKTANNYVDPENNYSRAVVFKVNEKKKTVSQVWQFGKEEGTRLYSTYMGNISLYEEKYISIHFGGNAKVNGKVIDMPGIFRKDFDSSCELSATTVELKDGKEICRMVFPMNTYQMERVSVQHKNDIHEWGIGERIGDYAETEEFPVDFPESIAMMPENYNLSFGYDGERLFIRADFLTAEMVMLKLQGEKEEHTFYIQSTRRPFYTMCPVTWRPGNGRPVEWPITVKDFNDIYKLIIMINENTYETGLVLDLRK